jgi:hypothetical protein
LMNLGALETFSWGISRFSILGANDVAQLQLRIMFLFLFCLLHYWMTGSSMSLLLILLKSFVKNCMTA